jgi:exopolysaccharide production protein ExoZ
MRITKPQMIAVAAIGVIALLVCGPTSNSTFQFRPLTWGLPAALIVAALALHDDGRQPKKPASVADRVCLALGAASYAMYLLHVLVMRGIVALAGPAPALPLWLLAASMIIISTAVGIVANRAGHAVAVRVQRPRSPVAAPYYPRRRGAPL